jgi:hypothetical protein
MIKVASRAWWRRNWRYVLANEINDLLLVDAEPERDYERTGITI